MSKELEALNGLFDLVHCQDSFEKAQKYFDILEEALQRLEAIDNANPSEALEDLIDMIEYFTRLDYVEPIVRNEIHDKFKDIYWHKLPHLDTIKQALIKAQEQKQYLKWEDLEFDNNASVKKHLKVKLGDNIYKAYYHYCFILNSELFCIENDNENLNIYITNRQFFNDLHLERVEE